MPNKNQVTITFAGDSKDASKAFAEVGESADKMSSQVDSSSAKLQQSFKDTASSAKGLNAETGKVHEGFDKAAEGADNAERHAMGARDAFTGVQDSMSSVAAFSKGDLTQGFLLAGTGAADLASGMANAVVPALKSVVTRIGFAKLAMIGLSAAAVGGGIALLAWGTSARHTSSDIKGLTEDMDRFVRTGKTTATLKRSFGEGANGIKEFADKLDVATSGFWNWHNSLNRTFDDISQSKSAFVDLDHAMAQLVDQGQNSETVFDSLSQKYKLNAEQVKQLRSVLPEFAEATNRAKDRTEDLTGAQQKAAEATQDQRSELKKLQDTMRAQTDPVFGFVHAQEAVYDAQVAVNEALSEHGRKSPEYQAAMVSLTEAQLDLFYAIGDVVTKTDKDLLPTLEQMRKDGFLSKDAFDLLTQKIKDAKRAADIADGTRVRMQAQIIADIQGRIQARIFGSVDNPGALPGIGQMIPKFHDGGTVPRTPSGEMLAVLRSGETVIPPGGGGGSVTKQYIPISGHPLVDSFIDEILREFNRRGVVVVAGG